MVAPAAVASAAGIGALWWWGSPALTALLTLAAAPTAALITVTIGSDGRASFALPRAEVGQGIVTSTAMIIAEELDLAAHGLRYIDCDPWAFVPATATAPPIVFRTDLDATCASIAASRVGPQLISLAIIGS